MNQCSESLASQVLATMFIRLEGQVKYNMNRKKLLLLKYVDRYRMVLLKDLLAIQYLAPLAKGYIPWRSHRCGQAAL